MRTKTKMSSSADPFDLKQLFLVRSAASHNTVAFCLSFQRLYGAVVNDHNPIAARISSSFPLRPCSWVRLLDLCKRSTHLLYGVLRTIQRSILMGNVRATPHLNLHTAKQHREILPASKPCSCQECETKIARPAVHEESATKLSMIRYSVRSTCVLAPTAGLARFRKACPENVCRLQRQLDTLLVDFLVGGTEYGRCHESNR